MRRRWWYAALLILPGFYGQSNVREGGDFLPGALMGLIIAALLVGLIEAGRFAARFLRRG
jgi:hypothetical protein